MACLSSHLLILALCHRFNLYISGLLLRSEVVSITHTFLNCCQVFHGGGLVITQEIAAMGRHRRPVWVPIMKRETNSKKVLWSLPHVLVVDWFWQVFIVIMQILVLGLHKFNAQSLGVFLRQGMPVGEWPGKTDNHKLSRI